MEKISQCSLGRFLLRCNITHLHLSLNFGILEVVAMFGRPQIVGFTETHSQRTQEHLQGYHVVAQLDRRTGEQGGGIALCARSGFEQFF